MVLLRQCTITDRRIAYAGGVELKCKRSEDAVLMASGIVSERIGSKCTVVRGLPEGRISVVAEECMMSHGSVVNAGDIAIECASTDSRVFHTFGVVDKCGRSSGRIEDTGCVVQKRCRANWRCFASQC